MSEPNPYAPPESPLGRTPVRPSLGRAIVAVLTGGIGVDLMLGTFSMGVLFGVWALLLGDADADGIEALAASFPGELFSFVVGMAFAAAGGYVAARIAPWRARPVAAAAGALSLVVSIPLALLGAEPGDLFQGAAGVGFVLQIPFAVLGGSLAARRAA